MLRIAGVHIGLKVLSMKIRKVPPGNVNWHLGTKFDVALGDIYKLNAMGDRTKIDVFIRDRTNGEIQYRIGDGRQIGNFHQVWINWNGEKVTIEEMLRSTTYD